MVSPRRVIWVQGDMVSSTLGLVGSGDSHRLPAECDSKARIRSTEQDRTDASDFVYVYFFGHGTRTTTVFSGLKDWSGAPSALISIKVDAAPAPITYQ
ncbi:hypothetical protein CHU98_g11057 [Xylaria longipes]|nr:hypothetical protein CHU98_g11057 [Xylaria longipes]